MKLTTLRELPVGAAFIRHDEWGDGHALYIKLSEHGRQPDDGFCITGRTNGTQPGPILASISVQRVHLGSELEVLAFCLASSLKKAQEATSEQQDPTPTN